MSFTIEDARQGNQPFSYGCTGFAGGGKSLSTLLLMQGVQRIKGGDIYVVDTDNTSNAYAGVVPHKRLFLRPPYSADNFREAFEACFKRGARMIIGDCMSEEHDGEGGLLDIRSKIPGKGLDGWGTAKEPRKRMERYMRSLRVNEDVVWGLTYRAELKYKPKTRDEKVRAETEGTPRDPTDHQWDITSTSGIPFMLDVRFLLPPGSDGKPLLKPTTVEEAIFMKSTLTHAAYLQTVTQLSADVGQRLYELSKGTGAKPAAARGVVEFRPTYTPKQGNIADADMPEVDAYLLWLHDQAAANSDNARTLGAINAHIRAVQEIYNKMLVAEAS